MSSRSHYTPQQQQFFRQVDFVDKIRPFFLNLINLIVVILCAIYGASAYHSWNVIKKNPSWFDDFADLHLKQEKIGFGASFARIAWGVLIAIPIFVADGWWLFAIGLGNLAFEIPIVDIVYNGWFLPGAPCSEGLTDAGDVSRCNFYIQYAEATGASPTDVESMFKTQDQTLNAFAIVALAAWWIGFIMWALIGKFKGKDTRRGGVETVAGIFA